MPNFNCMSTDSSTYLAIVQQDNWSDSVVYPIEIACTCLEMMILLQLVLVGCLPLCKLSPLSLQTASSC